MWFSLLMYVCQGPRMRGRIKMATDLNQQHYKELPHLNFVTATVLVARPDATAQC